MSGITGPDPIGYSVVVPTVARPSLRTLLTALADSEGPRPDAVVVVDDRPPASASPLDVSPDVRVLRSGGRGPAAARNAGWRSTVSPWVVFLDDDVAPEPGWALQLLDDLTGLPVEVAASQGVVRVPLAADRRPTDWERSVAGLEAARWITADMAYRREVLAEVGGFDERFPRAYREDADLGLRVANAGYVIVKGARTVEHPVRPSGRWVSVRTQAGNADDAMMRALHGTGWRDAVGAGPARNGRYSVSTAAAAGAVAAALTGRRALAGALGATWAATTAAFAAERIAPGPRTRSEVATMLVTSALIPPAAVFHAARGWAAVPGALRAEEGSPLGLGRSPLALRPSAALRPYRLRPRSRRVDTSWRPELILFDRDGTLIVDVPGNRDPDRVALMPGARRAVARARAAGMRTGVVTNQAAVGRGHTTLDEVLAINRRVDELLGPFDTWQVCPHAPADGCACRKPAPGLVQAAAAVVRVAAASSAVIGDIGSDLAAARAAGARGVLVPTRVTRPAEVAAAPVVAVDLLQAVDVVLAGMC